MQRIFVSAVFVFVMLGFSLLQFGCNTMDESPAIIVPDDQGGPPPWAPAHGYRAKHRYYYYPDHRVYFDPARSTYFYMSGNGWQVSTSLPSGTSIGTSNYVIIDTNEDRPYVYHRDIEKRYPHGQGRGNGNNGRGHGNGHGNGNNN